MVVSIDNNIHWLNKSSDFLEKYDLRDIINGAVIISVKEYTSAFDAGLRVGMVILRVGQVEVDEIKVIEDVYGLLIASILFVAILKVQNV